MKGWTRLRATAEIAFFLPQIDQPTKAFEASGDPSHLDAAIDANLALLHRPALRRDPELYAVACWEAARLVRRRIELSYRRIATLRDAPREDGAAEAASRRTQVANERTAVKVDIDLFIDLMRQAVVDFPSYSAYVANVRIDLGDALTRRFWLRESEPEAVNDLREAIGCYQEALDRYQPTGQNLHVCLVSLADLYFTLHQSLAGELSDRQTAESMARRALELTGLSPEHRFETLCVLADILTTAVQEGANDPSPLIEEAVALYDEVLGWPADQDANRALPRVRANLALALRLRYQLTGEAADLDRQIALLADALSEPDLRWL